MYIITWGFSVLSHIQCSFKYQIVFLNANPLWKSSIFRNLDLLLIFLNFWFLNCDISDLFCHLVKSYDYVLSFFFRKIFKINLWIVSVNFVSGNWKINELLYFRVWKEILWKPVAKPNFNILNDFNMIYRKNRN